MGVVVHRVDAPGVAGAHVVGVADPVDGRVAHRHVRRGHRVFADLGAHDVLAILVLAGAHIAEDRQRFLGRAVAERRILADLAEIAAVGGHVFGALAVDIGKALGDQVFGHQVQLLEIVAGVVQVVLAAVLPVKTEPFDAVDDGVDVFLLFFGRVGIVKTQVAAAVVVACQAEIDADRLGMAHVQVAVWLWREAGDHRRQARADVDVRCQVGFDLGAQEIGRCWRGGGGRLAIVINAHS